MTIFFTHIGYNPVIWPHQQKVRLENRLSLWLARRRNCLHVPQNFSVICLFNLSLNGHKDLTSSYHEIYPLFSKGDSSKYLAFTTRNLKSRICSCFVFFFQTFPWCMDVVSFGLVTCDLKKEICYLSNVSSVICHFHV